MNLFVRIMNGIIFFLLAMMIVFVTMQVINRYVFQFSIPWTEELTRTSYILLIFIGSALATYQNTHIRVLTGVQLLPMKVRRWLAVFSAVASAVFFAFVSFGNYVQMLINWGAKFTTVQWLNLGLVLAIVFVASVLTAVLFLTQAFGRDAEFEGLEDVQK